MLKHCGVTDQKQEATEEFFFENLSIEIVIEDPHFMAGSRDVVWLKEASFAGIQAELCNWRKQIEDWMVVA